MKQVESISHNAITAAAVAERCLERLKAALALLIEKDGFHIEHGVFCLEA